MVRRTLFVSLIALTCAIADGPAIGDGNWPKEIVTKDIRLLLYQPQVERWFDNRIESRSAVAVTRTGETNPIFGVIAINARTEVDREARVVSFEDIEISTASFPTALPLQSTLLNAIRESVPTWPRSVSLDRVLADMAINQAKGQAEGVRLKNDPPKIIFASTPSVLILIDGEPVYKPVEGTRYTRVMNTLALMLYDSAAGAFYLDGQSRWMTASSLSGPWTVSGNTPAEVNAIRDQVNKEEAEPAEPGGDTNEAAPAVYVSTMPAELVVTNGAPQFAPISGTTLLYVTNSDCDIFMDTPSQTYYVLLAGRWFASTSTSGTWTWVPGDKLPRDFANIAPDSPKGRVLASVPGTEQAREAVIENQIPQTATVNRSEARLNVRYFGPPQFKPIEGTDLSYAVNTVSEVIRAEGRYYAVQEGIWFVANSATGPWVVADMIPSAIYSIPPSSPLYHVRYAYVYGGTPDVVYVGYTPGYVGAFVSDGVVVFGTGWGYPGMLCGDYWCGWPWTWGFGFQFSYWSGGWFWRPVGHYWWNHNPVFAPRIYSGHWNPQSRTRNQVWVRNNLNLYNHWGQHAVAPRNPIGVRADAAQHPDLYGGKDGRVYQHNQSGWSAPNNKGQWQKLPPNPSLEQQRQSRTLGQSRQEEFRQKGQAPGVPRTVAPRRPAMPSRPPSPPRGRGRG